MKIELITKPDATGLGRVIVDGKIYGLPVVAVEAWRELQDDFEHVHVAYESIGKEYFKLLKAQKNDIK